MTELSIRPDDIAAAVLEGLEAAQRQRQGPQRRIRLLVGLRIDGRLVLATTPEPAGQPA